jgi:translocation and assembly module TamB
VALLRKAIKILAGILLCAVLLILAAFAAAQTQQGKAWIAGQVASALSGDGNSAQLGRIEGTIPFDMRLSELRLADAGGEYARVTNLAFACSPRALLSGRIEMTRLSADDIAVARLPEAKPAATPQPAASPGLPHLPLDFVLDDLTVGAVRLATPVLGEPVALSLSGAASLAGGAASGRLAIRRIDGKTGSADLSLAATGRPMQLKLALDVAEPSGLLLDRLLGREDRAPLAVSLKGDGPLADWHGVLAASSGDRARLAADLTIAESDGYHAGMRGTLTASRLLPPDFAPVLGDAVDFDARLRASPTGAVEIERLSVDAAAVTVTASGRYDPSGKTIAGDATATAADLAPLSGLAGMALTGAGRLQATVSGTPQRPQAELSLDGTALRAGGNGADRVAARFRIGSAGNIDEPGTRLTIAGGGSIENVVSAAGAVPAGLGDAVHWHLAGSSDMAGEAIEIAELRATSAGLDLAGSATVRDRGASVDGKASVNIADLSPFSTLAGQALRGSGKLDLVAGTTADGTVTATLSGGLSGLALGGPADALLGDRLAIDAAARRRADGSMAIEKLDLSGAHVALSTAGTRSADGKVSARIKLDVPTLGVLAAPLGTTMAGRLTLDATVEGQPDALAVTATLDGDDVAAGPARLDGLHLVFAVPDMAVQVGRLDGTFRAGKLDGTLGAELALHEDGRVLDVAKLRLAAAGSTIDGALRVALDSGLAGGTVNGRIVDLAPWSQLAGTPLAGRADVKAVLGTKGGQSVALSLDGNGIRAGAAPASTIAVAHVAANANLSDLRGMPAGHATIDLGKIEMGDAKLTALTMKLGSTKPGRFTFEGNARGRFRQNFALTTSGDFALERDGVTLRLARLSGNVAGDAVQLTRPLTLTRRRSDIALANLALTLGSGQLAGSFSLAGDELALVFKGQRLPVALAGKFAGPRDLSGTLSFDANVAGTRSKPRGRLVVDGRDLKFGGAGQSDLPALGVTAEAVWRGGRVELKGRIAGPKDEAIGFTGSAPVELTPGALAVRLPPDGAIDFRLEGAGQLADIEELLPLGEDRVAGKFSLDVNVAGTVAQPRAGGALRIGKGRYESMAAGTILDDVALEIVGDRERFVVRNFHATDGEGGQMSARGSVDLAATPGPAVDAAIDIAHFHVLRRDEAAITAGGEMRVSGPLTALHIASRLRVERGELRPPDRLPPSVANLDVIEINSVTGQRAPTPSPKPAESAPMLPATLDIVVELPGQVFVRGRGLDSEWRGKITVSGTSAAPIVVGALEVVRGNFALLGKDFKLTSGTIRFNGGSKIDPTLDIVAEATTADITGTVRIGGTASAPTLKLGSVPELPQDEVLSRILFGKSAGQISAAQGVQLAAAASSLAGGGGGLLDKVRSTLGLDRFDFGAGGTSSNAAGNASGNSASQSGLSGATVSAGKYVAEGVYVGVDQGASTGTSRGKVEIEIAPHVSVETDVGATGGNGLGLNWKMDY